MANLFLLFAGTAAFGFLLGLVTGLSKQESAGRDLVAALLGGGLITQIFTMLGGADLDLVSVALLGFGLGGVVGVLVGLVFRQGFQNRLRGKTR